MNEVFCQSCSMPIHDEALFGRESSGEINTNYCLYCFENGRFKQEDITMEEMIEYCVPFLIEDGMKEEEATSLLKQSIPYLKRWRKGGGTFQPIFKNKDAFTFMGISTRTRNEVEARQGGRIPSLWEQYYGQKVADKIGYSGSEEPTVALYSDYESDVSGEYQFSIGKSVKNVGDKVNDFYVKVIPASTYAVFTTEKGNLTDVVGKAWLDIWAWFQSSGLERTYTGDFEIYDERCMDLSNVQVDIYVAIKNTEL